MLCSELTAVNEGPDGGVVISLRCKRWTCPLCQPWLRWRVSDRAKAGSPSSFITLTSVPESAPTPSLAAQRMKHGFALLRRRMARELGIVRLPFFAVFEATKAGWPHLHVLARAPFIDQRWLSANWHGLTGAKIVDIRRVGEARSAAAYVSKYVGKDPHRFEGTKRFWCSRDWLPPTFREADEITLPSESWQTMMRRLDTLAAAFEARGFATKRTSAALYFGALAA